MTATHDRASNREAPATTDGARSPADRSTAPEPPRTGAAVGGLRSLLRSDRLLKIFAWSAVVTNGVIAVTGATVRVTGSGLGCASWPECQPGTLVPEYRTGMASVRQAIEFTNRTFTGIVLVASLGTFVLLWLHRPRRRAVLRWAAVGVVGVLVEAVWGGVVVHLELAWWTVAPHMLVSLLLVSFALVTAVRIGESDGPARNLVPGPLRVLAQATLGVLGALCIAGTLVTAAGPHGGDVNTARLDIPVRALAQVHADLMFGFFGLLVALTVGFLAVKAPPGLLKRGWLLVGVTAAQGILGLVQYATGVPEVLVVTHVLGAVLVVLAGTWMVLGTRIRGVDQLPG